MPEKRPAPATTAATVEMDLCDHHSLSLSLSHFQENLPRGTESALPSFSAHFPEDANCETELDGCGAAAVGAVVAHLSHTPLLTTGIATGTTGSGSNV